jgi:hypothetical protein
MCSAQNVTDNVTNDLNRLINDYKLSHLFIINVDPVLVIFHSVAVDCVMNFWRNMMAPNLGWAPEVLLLTRVKFLLRASKSVEQRTGLL